jgi:hypothetical protein
MVRISFVAPSRRDPEASKGSRTRKGIREVVIGKLGLDKTSGHAFVSQPTPLVAAG